MVEMDMVDLAFKLAGLIVLVLVLVFILTWSGMIKCGDIPFWCDVYETVLGEPNILIVHGDEGLGNPDELRAILQDPKKVGINQVDIAHVDTISLGNLKKYKLVIVEQARQLSIDQLSMFMEYAGLSGGRLIWVGDAGTQRGEDELDNLIDTNGSKKILDNPWARAKENDNEYIVLNFDEFLGLRYSGRYCEEFNCVTGLFSVGMMRTELTGDHPLIFGFSALELKVRPERDFALVRQFPNSSNSNIIMNLDFGSVKQGLKNSFPRYVPLITTSGFGEKVAYYAYPIESFCKDNEYPNACILLAKNMYYGMLGK